MEIGRPVRIIEVEPVEVPLPSTLPDPEPVIKPVPEGEPSKGGDR